MSDRNKNTFILALLLTVEFFFACNATPKINKLIAADHYPMLIDVNVDSCKIIKSSILIDTASIEYLPLKSDSNNIIGRVDKIRFTSNKIIIGDFTVSNCLFIYDTGGTFIKSFNKKNLGISTYTNFNDFDYDVNENQLFMLVDGKKLLSVDINTGQINKVYNLPFYSFKFTKVGADQFLFYTGFRDNQNYFKSNRNYNLILSSRKGDAFSFGLPYNKEIIKANDILFCDGFSSKSSSRTFVSTPGNDTVFEFQNHQLHPYAYFNFGSKSLPSNFSQVLFEEPKIKLYQKSAKLESSFFYQNDSIVVYPSVELHIACDLAKG